jgi:hypothetical protein
VIGLAGARLCLVPIIWFGSGQLRFRTRRAQLGECAVSDHADIAFTQVEGSGDYLVLVSSRSNRRTSCSLPGANAEHRLGEFVVAAMGERMRRR